MRFFFVGSYRAGLAPPNRAGGVNPTLQSYFDGNFVILLVYILQADLPANSIRTQKNKRATGAKNAGKIQPDDYNCRNNAIYTD